MKNLQAIFFDFDGVILESIDVKAWAFGKLFEAYPDHQKRIVDYHMSNGGVSRYAKFRHIYKTILKEPLSEDHFQSLCDQYSALVFDRVLQCEFVAGAKEFLNKYYKILPLFVISGTPMEEMQSIVEKRGLNKYFKEVCGSPREKKDLMRELLEKYTLNPAQTPFVGDALSDYEAAVDNGSPFVARVPDGTKDIFTGKEVFSRINDLKELEAVLRKVDQQCLLSE